MARAADPAGIRTVGIITKCDALQPGDEHEFVCLPISEPYRAQDDFLSHPRMPECSVVSAGQRCPRSPTFVYAE